MNKEYITLSHKEVRRLKIINKVMEGQVSQIKAAEILGISDRQVRNVIKKLREHGDRGIAHGNRGRTSSMRMAPQQEDLIAEIVGRRYLDFGPTLAAEKLLECEGIKVSNEKLRQIMLGRDLWQRKRRRRKIHRWRERKAYFGEMVQMDGSHHDWLEGRGSKMVLMGYVDDATGHFFGRFYDYEGLFPAMDSLEHYIRLYGCPVTLYLDKHSTYKTTRQPDLDELLRGEQAQTQFQRAARELDIEIIHAHSPQAKGRVERAFGTLQDRLVKELRLAGACTKEEANLLLSDFIPKYNNRFGKIALKEGNLHRRLPKGIKFKDILCRKAIRTIANDYTIRLRGRRYLIDNASLVKRKQRVEVREYIDGKISIKANAHYLSCQEVFEAKPVSTQPQKASVMGREKRKGKYIPPSDHPWKRHDPALHHNSYLKRI
ncbi:ISNCY family transposase [Acidobacteriota bacterium]